MQKKHARGQTSGASRCGTNTDTHAPLMGACIMRLARVSVYTFSLYRYYNILCNDNIRCVIIMLTRSKTTTSTTTTHHLLHAHVPHRRCLHVTLRVDVCAYVWGVSCFRLSARSRGACVRWCHHHHRITAFQKTIIMLLACVGSAECVHWCACWWWFGDGGFNPKHSHTSRAQTASTELAVLSKRMYTART